MRKLSAILVFAAGLGLTRLNGQPAPGTVTTHALPSSGPSVITAAGNVYVTGQDGPTTPGAAQAQPGGGACSPGLPFVGALTVIGCSDAWIGKIDAAGKMVFGTLLGGSKNDIGAALAVDAAGNVFIAGTTGGSFPTTANAAIASSTSSKGFAAKVSADGSRFLYATYLPDAAATVAGIAVDAQGDAHVVGHTFDGHAYVTKLNADGSAFLYDIVLGGTSQDWTNAVALDALGNAVVVGQTASADFPVTPGVVQSHNAGESDVFAVKLDASGRIIFSTYLGGTDEDRPNAVQIDRAGNIYVAGGTLSLDFPTTPGSLQPIALVPLWSNSPGGFIAKLTADGSTLAYSSYVRSINDTQLGVTSLAVTASGEAFVSGRTGVVFPVTDSAPQQCFGGSSDIFVAHLDAQGALRDATYLGGRLDDTVNGLALADDGSVLLASHDAGGTGVFSQIRFGDPAWSAPPCMSPDVLNSVFLKGPGGDTPFGVTPGEFISLTGLGIGPKVGVGYQPGAQGQVPLDLAGVKVFFDGQAAPVLYAQSRQVNAQAPFELSGRTTTTIRLEYNGIAFGPVSVPVTVAAPGIFRLQPNVSTQAWAINQDGTMNSAANPAVRGTVVTLLGAGFGATDPACATGFNAGEPVGAVPDVSVLFRNASGPLNTFGPAEPVLGVRGVLCGVVKINMLVPDQAPSGAFPFAASVMTPVESGITSRGIAGGTIAVK